MIKIGLTKVLYLYIKFTQKWEKLCNRGRPQVQPWYQKHGHSAPIFSNIKFFSTIYLFIYISLFMRSEGERKIIYDLNILFIFIVLFCYNGTNLGIY